MKKQSVSFCIFFLISIFALAQQDNSKVNRGDKKEKIKQLYVAYITEELTLNEEEAQKFWPIQLQYDKEIKTVIKKEMPELEREENVLIIRKKYAAKFEKILGSKRTDLFFKKDREFRNKLIDHLRKKRLGHRVENDKKIP